MTDPFARSTAWVALGQSAVKLSQVVIAAALVRIVDGATWNETAFLLTVYVTGVSIGALNAHHGIAYFLPRVEFDRRRSLVTRTMTFVLVVGALGIAATALATGTFSGGNGHSRLVVVMAAVALELPSGCVGTTLIALRRFAGAATWDLVGTVGVVAGCLIPAVSGAGPDGIAWGLVAAGALRLPVGLLIVRRMLPGGARVDRAVVLGLVRYGLPLALTITVAMLNRVVDKWYIAWFDPDHFGIYAVAAQEIPILSVLPYAGGAALLAALVESFHADDLATARGHWIHLTTRMSTFVVPIGFGVAMIGPDLLTVAFTPAFAPAALSFQIFALITVHRVAEYGMLLRAAGRTRAVVVIALATLVANAVLAGIGAAVGGMTGASLGTAAATALGWLVAMWFIADTFDARIRDSFAWLAWTVQVGIALAAMTFAEIVANNVDARIGLGTPARVVVEIIVFAAVVLTGTRRWRAHPRSAGPAIRYVAERPLAAIAGDVR